MRLLIHAAGIAGGGGLRHLCGFLPELGQALAGHGEAIVTVRESVARSFPTSSPRIEILTLPDSMASSPAARMLIDQAWVPARARHARVDLLISLANFGPVWTPAPHVVFQTNAIYFDPRILERASPLERVDLTLRREATLLAMRNASVVVTPSRAMRDLVVRAAPRLADRVVTLPHGIVKSAFPTRSPRRHGSGPFVFLCPGVAASYKGLDVLLPGMAAARLTDVEVRAFANEAHWPSGIREARRRAFELGLGERFRIFEELPLDEMPAAYAEADALVYPTLCESFGFALLEALSSGLPVVASDIPVNREIAGDAALYYDPLSPEALGSAMKKIAEDEPLRTELRRRASKRLEAFDWSWRRHATDFLTLMDQVGRRA